MRFYIRTFAHAPERWGISMTFKIKQYGRTELAQLYCPDIAPESAWKRFKGWMEAHPTLKNTLTNSGYSHRQRTFTPYQVGEIVAALGEP